jgi:protocatechuate 3,4-dioxygenase beta subunit
MRVDHQRLVWLATMLALTVPAVAPVAVQAQHAYGQQEGRGRSGVSGAVLDAVSGVPLDGATVLLQPEMAGAFPGGPATGSAFAAALRAAVSARDGSYTFAGLAPGVYRIYVTRLAYRPYSVAVELRGASHLTVAIALEAEPIPLDAVRSMALTRGPYERADAFSADVDFARLVAAEQRRRQFLTTDARELTHADVIEAITLGEPDVMRALQRLPGVTTRSDYTAELWTRGAPWSHTRVYFDGVPLFNPLHALGMVSGIGSNAIGAVWFHPGARSAGIGEGAAGVIDLQSRRAHGAGELNAQLDVSLVSAGLALDQRVLDGRAGWMLAGRHAYMDWLTGLARRASGRDESSFPYGFSEVAGSVDAWTGEKGVFEASWLWERDHLTSTRPDAVDALRAEWGNVAGRASFTTMLGGVYARHTVMASAHDADVLPEAWRTAWRQGDVPTNTTGYAAIDGSSKVRSSGVSGTIWPEPRSLAGPAWSLGYGLDLHQASYRGPQVLPVPRFARTLAAEPGTGVEHTVQVGWSSDLVVGTFWGERTQTIGDRLGLRAGLRAEVGPGASNTDAVRLSPRLSVRYTASPEVALSGGLSRVYQYTQAVAPGGVHIASLSSTDVWLVAGTGIPALKSDIATLGLETWLGPGRIATLNGFGRHATGIATPDPRPGRIYDRPTFVEGENSAYGVELAVRQITGFVTGSASYSLSESRMTAEDLEYPAAADRRHVVSTTAMVRATESIRAGAAFTAASGVPFTRTIATAEECAAEPGCDPQLLPWMGRPHAERAPTFASLDLLFDWSRRVRSMDIGVYAQLRNALGRENATVYTGDEASCTPVGCGEDLRSIYERGVPRLPVVGLRVRH